MALRRPLLLVCVLTIVLGIGVDRNRTVFDEDDEVHTASASLTGKVQQPRMKPVRVMISAGHRRVHQRAAGRKDSSQFSTSTIAEPAFVAKPEDKYAAHVFSEITEANPEYLAGGVNIYSNANVSCCNNAFSPELTTSLANPNGNDPDKENPTGEALSKSVLSLTLKSSRYPLLRPQIHHLTLSTLSKARSSQRCLEFTDKYTRASVFDIDSKMKMAAKIVMTRPTTPKLRVNNSMANNCADVFDPETQSDCAGRIRYKARYINSKQSSPKTRDLLATEKLTFFKVFDAGLIDSFQSNELNETENPKLNTTADKIGFDIPWTGRYFDSEVCRKEYQPITLDSNCGLKEDEEIWESVLSNISLYSFLYVEKAGKSEDKTCPRERQLKIVSFVIMLAQVLSRNSDLRRRVLQTLHCVLIQHCSIHNAIKTAVRTVLTSEGLSTLLPQSKNGKLLKQDPEKPTKNGLTSLPNKRSAIRDFLELLGVFEDENQGKLNPDKDDKGDGSRYKSGFDLEKDTHRNSALTRNELKLSDHYTRSTLTRNEFELSQYYTRFVPRQPLVYTLFPARFLPGSDVCVKGRMKSVLSRLGSLNALPASCDVSRVRLAEAGFYYNNKATTDNARDNSGNGCGGNYVAGDSDISRDSNNFGDGKNTFRDTNNISLDSSSFSRDKNNTSGGTNTTSRDTNNNAEHEVVCFSCGFTYSDWKRGDNPTIIHASLRPDCEHIKSKTASTASAQLGASASVLSNDTERALTSQASSGPFSSDGASSLEYASASSASISAVSGNSLSLSDSGVGTGSFSFEQRSFPDSSSSGSSHHSGSSTTSMAYDSGDLATDCAAIVPSAQRSLHQSDLTTSRNITTQYRQHTQSALPENSRLTNHSVFAPSRDMRRARALEVEDHPPLDMERAVYPQFCLQGERRATFTPWPLADVFGPDDLVMQGFYYAGYADCIRCFYCGVGLKSWAKDDDVMVEHIRWRPSCGYILNTKGRQFVDTVLRSLGQASRSEQSSSDLSNPETPKNSSMPHPSTTTTNLASVTQPLSVTKQPSVIQSSPQANVSSNLFTNGPSSASENSGVAISSSASSASAAASAVTPSDGNASIGNGASREVLERVQDMGFSVTCITRAVRHFQQIGQTKISADLLVEKILELSSEDSNRDGENATPHNGLQTDGPESAANLGMVDVETERAQQIRNENERLRSRQTCKICRQAQVGMIFLPCGHIVACTDCGARTRKCTHCGEYIKATANVFLS